MAVVFETIVVADDVDVAVCEAADVIDPAVVVSGIVGKLVVIWPVVLTSFPEVGVAILVDVDDATVVVGETVLVLEIVFGESVVFAKVAGIAFDAEALVDCTSFFREVLPIWPLVN